jgi:hypothetical protein
MSLTIFTLTWEPNLEVDTTSVRFTDVEGAFTNYAIWEL